MHQRRLSTIILVVLLVLVLVFPGIGEKGERIVSVIVGVFTVLAVFFGPEIRQLVRGTEHERSAVPSTKSVGKSDASHQETNVGQKTQPDKDARVSVRDEARQVATELNEWIYERRLDDPFSRSIREGNNPEMGTPAYRALEAAYHNHSDETERQYQNNFLSKLAKVRADLASYNIRDSELNRIYGRPRGYNDYQIVVERLWEMAGNLDQRIGH